MIKKILEINVDDKLSNMTIKQVLQDKYSFSNRIISKVKNSNGIVKNGNLAYINDVLNLNDNLQILIQESSSENIIPIKMDLNIIYEDEYILAINKPPNLVVHPTSYHYDDTLANGIVYYFEQKNLECKFRVINRLDKDTSGIVLIAKSQLCHSLLSQQIINGGFKKEYIAVVHNKISQDKGIIDAKIARKDDSIIERIVSENGQSALTEYAVISKNENASLVKINLLTGRTHQIRVHFKHIGHILYGDDLYNAEDDFERQALHCISIKFEHPFTHQNINFFAPIPDDIIDLIAFLKLEKISLNNF